MENLDLGITLKGNRILVKKFDKVEKTAAGIILPEEDQVAPEGGEIVAVGNGTWDQNGNFRAMEYYVGQKVRYMEHGQTVKINNEEYYMIRDTDIWCEIIMTGHEQ